MVLTNCKKGENDPFLSFRSRDKRLVGNWTISKVDNTSITDIKGNSVNYPSLAAATYNNDYTNSLTTITTTFDGSTLNYSNVVSTTNFHYSTVYPATTPSSVVTTTGSTTTNVYTYSIGITIEEQGIAKVTEVSTAKTQTLSHTPAQTCPVGYGTPGLTCDGTYTVTTPTTTTTNFEGTWHWGTEKKNKDMLVLEGVGSYSGTYYIQQLKMKEIVLIQKSVSNNTDSGASNSSNAISDNNTVTLTRK
ncbi:MAG: hypothetical protein A2275_11210 [Bacteroidetes bacterium RIFOXYA12_FULL_35_11]|nr:MAG: hypothetical protein A2X01_19155 [Bacteroidetes bacterium GWF2_35_48]OFY74409.1 MAG: hypothetical protein A2275_11210 [Bacteroidetes bacterium RIFOXYA12_FULL_35_11]OFY93577.1 MAG: hypothetical protein A2491_00825 [Bacteroidetes bacterium RIFOXYC12_FULL_35_7]HBX50715.1 hypothetical protein [Bacteroidales bacterium]